MHRRRMLSILDFRDDLAPAFRAINREWIEAMYQMEPHDHELLANPRHYIIDPGGAILFVAVDGVIVGTGALLPSGNGALELSKMGVTEAARGSGAGAFLLAALIERARAMAPPTLFLLTNRKSEAAIHLYERAGFRHDPAIMARYGAAYDRCDVAMSHPLETAPNS